MTIHVVQAGETVGSIAASYGVDPARLAADNAVAPSGALAVGQTLVVRFPRQVHAVRAGETLASIAEAYGTTVRRLWQNNWPLGGQTALRPGQVLVISYFGAPRPPPPSTVTPIPTSTSPCWMRSSPISPTWRPSPTASPPKATCSSWRMMHCSPPRGSGASGR